MQTWQVRTFCDIINIYQIYLCPLPSKVWLSQDTRLRNVYAAELVMYLLKDGAVPRPLLFVLASIRQFFIGVSRPCFWLKSALYRSLCAFSEK